MSIEATPLPSTISIEAKHKDNLIESVLDQTNFMYLGKPGAQRDELFLFAMALGWRHDLSVKLDKPCSGGFIRTSSFSSQLSAMIDLARFKQADFKSSDCLMDHKGSYRLAEAYANGGLGLIEGETESNMDSETYANMLIAEMDDMYREFFPDR